MKWQAPIAFLTTTCSHSHGQENKDAILALLNFSL